MVNVAKNFGNCNSIMVYDVLPLGSVSSYFNACNAESAGEASISS